MITGAVEAMVVDVQCVMPALGDLTGCYHTKFISTSPKADFPNTVRMEFHEEKAYETAKEIIRMAVENFPNRNPEKVNIPEEKQECMVGFSPEAILKALGGTPDPLIQAIAGGSIRGIGAVVGCNNVKIPHNYGHVNLVTGTYQKQRACSHNRLQCDCLCRSRAPYARRLRTCRRRFESCLQSPWHPPCASHGFLC